MVKQKKYELTDGGYVSFSWDDVQSIHIKKNNTLVILKNNSKYLLKDSIVKLLNKNMWPEINITKRKERKS